MQIEYKKYLTALGAATLFTTAFAATLAAATLAAATLAAATLAAAALGPATLGPATLAFGPVSTSNLSRLLRV